MLASTKAAGLPSDLTRDSKKSPSSSSSSSSSSIPFTTSNYHYTTALQPSSSASASTKNLRSLHPSPSRTPSSSIHPSFLSSKPNKTHLTNPSTPSIPTPKHHFSHTIRDHLWRQYQLFTATWGISVMQPWEQLFTLLLFSSLLALFILAFLKLPSCILYSAQRLGYYIFGVTSHHIPPSSFSSVLNHSLPVAEAPKGESVLAGVKVDLDICKQILAKSFNATNIRPAELSQAMPGLVDGGWLSE